MKNKNEDKPNKLVLDIIKDLKELEKQIHSDFIKIKIMQIEVKLRKLL